MDTYAWNGNEWALEGKQAPKPVQEKIERCRYCNEPTNTRHDFHPECMNKVDKVHETRRGPGRK